MVQLTMNANASFRFFRFLAAGRRDPERLDHVHGAAVPADRADDRSDPFASPIVAAQVPVAVRVHGIGHEPAGTDRGRAIQGRGRPVRERRQRQRQLVAVPHHAAAAADRRRPRPHAHHSRDRHVRHDRRDLAVRSPFSPQPPIVVPPGSDTTFTGAPTTSSITSWTRLEPQSHQCRHRHQLQRPRVRSAVDADPPVADGGVPGRGCRHADPGARRAPTAATLCRRFSGELPKSATPAPAPVAAQRLRSAADAARGARRAAPHARDRRDRRPHADVRRRVRAPLPADARARRRCRRAIGRAFITKLALQPLSDASSALIDDASARYMQSMVGRAPDGRQLAVLLRTIGAAQLVARSGTEHRRRRSAEGPAGGHELARLVRLDVQRARRPRRRCVESAAAGIRARRSARRLSANAGDEMTFSASEIDGPIDWSSFDVTSQASLTTAADQGFASHRRGDDPRAGDLPGRAGAAVLGDGGRPHRIRAGARWSNRPRAAADDRVRQQLRQRLVRRPAARCPSARSPASTRWCVTDTFGVRSLIRPIGDPSIPPAFFSMWQPALRNRDRRSARRRSRRTASSCRRR